MSGGHHSNIGHAPAPSDYVIGFVGAVILTVIPFAAVMKGMVSGTQAVWLIMGLAAVQILVHLRFFLHINRDTNHWIMQALVFTFFVLGIIISGSLWVMYHMNHNMMPMMPIDG